VPDPASPPSSGFAAQRARDVSITWRPGSLSGSRSRATLAAWHAGLVLREGAMNWRPRVRLEPRCYRATRRQARSVPGLRGGRVRSSRVSTGPRANTPCEIPLLSCRQCGTLLASQLGYAQHGRVPSGADLRQPVCHELQLAHGSLHPPVACRPAASSETVRVYCGANLRCIWISASASPS
jgi:hypothetical protein